MRSPHDVKLASEAALRALGGFSPDSLPEIGLDELELRPSIEVARRALVVHGLLGLSYDVPPSEIRDWFDRHDLLDAVSPEEQPFLDAAVLDDKQKNLMRWNVEPLWAAAWAGGFVADLGPAQPIGDMLASFFPRIDDSDSPDAFLGRFRLRPLEELHEKLDLFYRAHWYARDCHINGKDARPFHIGVVRCRRQLLEWATHPDDGWDEVDLST